MFLSLNLVSRLVGVCRVQCTILFPGQCVTWHKYHGLSRIVRVSEVEFYVSQYFVSFYKAGENQWGTDEAEIQSVLCSRSYPQLKATFDAYESIAGKDIEEAIESECSGTLQDGYLAISELIKFNMLRNLFRLIHDKVSVLQLLLINFEVIILQLLPILKIVPYLGLYNIYFIYSNLLL